MSIDFDCVSLGLQFPQLSANNKLQPTVYSFTSREQVSREICFRAGVVDVDRKTNLARKPMENELARRLFAYYSMIFRFAAWYKQVTVNAAGWNLVHMCFTQDHSSIEASFILLLYFRPTRSWKFTWRRRTSRRQLSKSRKSPASRYTREDIKTTVACVGASVVPVIGIGMFNITIIISRYLRASKKYYRRLSERAP